MTLRLLLADADPAVRGGLARALSALGCAVRETADARELERLLASGQFDGAFVGGAFTSLTGATPWIALLPRARLAEAVAALERGACHFVELPCSRERLHAALGRLETAVLNARTRETARAGETELLSGRSPAMRRLVEQIERVARTPRTTVLLRGDRGVEVESVARAIHCRSARSQAAFVVCRATALDPTELEREFAAALVAGRGGTIFLDDVDALPLGVQAALLRVLTDRSERSNGALDEQVADVRLIAATGGRLDEAVARGVFREDLFYRINVLSIAVPPLRERGTDVLELARHRLSRAAAECGRRVRGFTPAAEAALLAHRWPGNTKELVNTIERAVLFARSAMIDVADLGLTVAGESADAAQSLPLGDRSLRAVERALIERVLGEVGGNKRRAAELLGINRATLYNKLRSFTPGA